MATAYNTPVRQISGHPAVSAENYFKGLADLIPRVPYEEIDRIVGVLFQAIDNERTVFVFGNGGSATSASHMMCDLNKGTADAVHTRRPKFLALTDNVALLTAWANDRGYEHVFSEQMKGFVHSGDVAFAISASGNSPNILRALETARERGAFTAGITGYAGGKMKAACDLCAVVPSDNVQLIEDIHHAILHSIFTGLHSKLRESGRKALSIAAGNSRS